MDQIVETRYIQVDYESRVTWKLYTDNLRCNPLFHGAPWYDHIIYTINQAEVGFAQLQFVFVCEFMGTRYALALVRRLDVVRTRRTVDQDLGLCRVRCTNIRHASQFIPVTSIVRGALITPDVAKASDSFVVDAVDGDMFLRLRQDFPFWDT